jgi:hypothetical protein
VNVNPFLPTDLIGRKLELERTCQILSADGDILLAGIPGIGRKTLIRAAAEQVGAQVVEIDCLRATSYKRFLSLMAEAFLRAFDTPRSHGILQRWSRRHPLTLDRTGQPRLTWPKSEDWTVFQSLLALPQALAEGLDCRVVLVFQNFPHIRSWDKDGRWENYLKAEIQVQTRVSYALIATFAESWGEPGEVQVVSLQPIATVDMADWVTKALPMEGLVLEPDAADLFADYVRGHFGDAIALARRVWLDQQVSGSWHQGSLAENIVQAHHVHRSALALVDDLAVTFESLILLLPPTQVRVLESLALDPTDSPHAREYIKKHDLSRGGALQGALGSLAQKGLLYGAELNYQIALPLLAFWLKHRLH